MTEPDVPELIVRKFVAHVPVSMEMMLDAGAITEEEARAQGWTPPPPQPAVRAPLRRQLSWWWNRQRLRMGIRIGSLIAGERLDLNEGSADDD